MGTFTIVDDSIISSYRSQDGGYGGAEYLLRISETVYKSRGVTFKGGEKLSAWAVELRRL